MSVTSARIPKIIHQIWIGPNPKPISWIHTFEDFSKQYGYEHTLWSEGNIDQLPWDKFPGLKTLYDSFGNAYAGKSDILRYIILYTKGGIYIDADSVVIKPTKFADFLKQNKASLFFGFEEFTPESKPTNPDLQNDLIDGNKFIANGTIGSTKHNPFMELVCKEVIQNAEREKTKEAWIRTGPVFITRMYMRYKDTYPDITVYPMKYFYPIHWKNITDPTLHTKIKLPEESMLFQYGYTTNNFAKIFKEQGHSGGKRTRHSQRKRRKGLHRITMKQRK